MRKRVLSLLILFLLLLLLLPFTDYGRSVLSMLAEPANREDFSIPIFTMNPEANENHNAEPAPEASVPDFIGEYVLISVSGDEDDIHEEDLAMIRSLGIPLHLLIRKDGTAQLDIFDRSETLSWEGNSLFELDSANQYFFYYEDGLLTVQEDNVSLLFEKLF